MSYHDGQYSMRPEVRGGSDSGTPGKGVMFKCEVYLHPMNSRLESAHPSLRKGTATYPFDPVRIRRTVRTRFPPCQPFRISANF